MSSLAEKPSRTNIPHFGQAFVEPNPEEAVLGSMLLRPEIAGEVIAVLGSSPEHFIKESNACVYRALVSLYQANKPLDLVTLAYELERTGKLSLAGGRTMVAALPDAVPTSANVVHYAKILQERTLKKELETAYTAFKRDGDVDKFLLDTQQIYQERRPSKLLPLADMAGWKDLASKALPSVFEEGLPLKKLGILAGDGGTGKSYLALELALSVALRRPLIRGFTPTNHSDGPVLCCFAEDDEHVVSQRLKSVCKALDVTEDEVDHLVESGRFQFIAGDSTPLLKPDNSGGYMRGPGFGRLDGLARKNSYSLIVIDPLIAWAGVSDENSNSAIQQAANTLIDLAKASGGAVLCCHHTNKSGSRAADMSQNVSRGGSSLQCAARSMCTIRTLGEQDASQFDLPSDEVTDYVEVAFAKNSYAFRSPRSSFLHRENGGALRSIDLMEARKLRVAKLIADVLRDAAAHPTRRELARGQGENAKKLRTELIDQCDGLSGREIDAAIVFGVERDILCERSPERAKPGVQRKEIFPGPEHDESD